jgi:hypothetical protein
MIRPPAKGAAVAIFHKQRSQLREETDRSDKAYSGYCESQNTKHMQLDIGVA